jgi:hypothetical protein
MEFEYQPRAIDRLIRDVNEGRLGLPEFQRRFVWKPKDVAELLRTVLRGWPAGSFLLLQNAEAQLPWRGISAAPEPEDPEWLLLDGQQRMTSLYHALTNRGDETYYVNLASVREFGELDDEHLKYERKTRFVRTYPDIAAQARAGVASVEILAEEEKFFEWLSYISENQRAEFIAVRREKLPGLSHYEVPIIRLTRDVPLAAVAKVFETLNKTGLKLGTFDLMVAKLYPHEFNLREAWELVDATHPILRQFDVGGIDVLKVVALREHLRNYYANSRTNVKGVREADVLNLPPATVIEDWEKAVDGLRTAIDFLRDRCGVVRGGLLPSQTMLLPLADALLSPGSDREDVRQQLVQWFWASSFLQTYSQGANTQAVADARALRAWQIDPRVPPNAIGNFERGFDRSALLDSRRRNEMLVLGIACLLVSRDGRDWKADERFKDSTNELEIHHIFAEAFVDRRGEDDPHVVANLTLLAAATNAALRNDSPRTVLENHDVSQVAMETHAMDLRRFAAEDYRAFLDDRAERLTRLIYDSVGISPRGTPIAQRA